MKEEGPSLERRRYMRIISDMPVELKEMPQNYPVTIRQTVSLDISEGGLRISSFYFYPVNSRVVVKVFLSRDIGPISAVGKVVWVEQFPYQERYKMGLEFADIDEEGYRHLKKLISNAGSQIRNLEPPCNL